MSDVPTVLSLVDAEELAKEELSKEVEPETLVEGQKSGSGAGSAGAGPSPPRAAFIASSCTPPTTTVTVETQESGI